MSKFDDAIRRYSALALRYQGQVLELGALSQVFYCYALTRQPEKAQAVATRMRAALKHNRHKAARIFSNLRPENSRLLVRI